MEARREEEEEEERRERGDMKQKKGMMPRRWV